MKFSVFQRFFDLAKRFKRDESGTAFLQLALMLPATLTVIIAGAEVSNTYSKRSNFSLCMSATSTNFSSLVWIDGDTIVQTSTNDCLGDLARDTRARIICYRRIGLAEPEPAPVNGVPTSPISIYTTLDVLNGGEILPSNPQLAANWAQPEIPDDFFGFGEGACVTQACLSTEPIYRLALIQIDAFDRFFASLDGDHCLAYWAQARMTNHVMNWRESDRLQDIYDDESGRSDPATNSLLNYRMNGFNTDHMVFF